MRDGTWVYSEGRKREKENEKVAAALWPVVECNQSIIIVARARALLYYYYLCRSLSLSLSLSLWFKNKNPCACKQRVACLHVVGDAKAGSCARAHSLDYRHNRRVCVCVFVYMCVGDVGFCSNFRFICISLFHYSRYLLSLCVE